MATFGEFDVSLTATYRLQFHKDFGFEDAARLAPYLAELGISHVYASPIMTARAGSVHGYDVIDFERVNPELGGEAGLEALVEALHASGLGLIVDVVPNHMSVGYSDNPLWLDLLEKGRDSAYADFFDVDFDAAGLSGKILVPLLGRSYGEALAGGELVLRKRGDGRYAVFHHEHCFPLRDVDQSEIEAEGPDAFAAPERLHALLEAQHYRLASWRTSNDLVNYRRFFEITTLAGIRIERASVFDKVHRAPLDLYAKGWIDGLRIDHIDGLTDPAGYADRLREALNQRRGGAYVVVEKILASDERLPPWAVFGTTGYDFMNEVSALQHDEAGAKPLGEYWRQVSGRAENFEWEEYIARRELLDVNFCGQFESVVDQMQRCASLLQPDRDLTRHAIQRAVRAVISHMRVYRSYALGGAENPGAGPDLNAAFEAALADATPETEAIHRLQAVMEDRSDRPLIAEAIRRFHQLTSPVAAKSVEDTAFYRYGRLLSRNDVGFDAGRLSMSLAAFHARMKQRAETMPHSLLATATHDHKRGEDSRARLAVLSEIADVWTEKARAWSETNSALRGEVNPADEYFLYQTIVGAWPLDLDPTDGPALAGFADRLVEWQRKALREGKLRSSWLSPNEAYERAAEQFTRALLSPEAPPRFLEAVSAFVRAITSAGIVNSLTQAALKCLAPGVPDIYQGRELWDFSLVDPDNRTPVDYATREGLLKQEGPGAASGAVKQDLIRRLLLLRREAPALFAHGDYAAVAVEALRGAEVLAFTRQHEGRKLAAAMLLRVGATLYEKDQLVPPPEFWGDARLEIAGGGFKSIYGGVDAGPTAPLAEIFARSPVVVWLGS